MRRNRQPDQGSGARMLRPARAAENTESSAGGSAQADANLAKQISQQHALSEE